MKPKLIDFQEVLETISVASSKNDHEKDFNLLSKAFCGTLELWIPTINLQRMQKNQTNREESKLKMKKKKNSVEGRIKISKRNPEIMLKCWIVISC